MTFTLPLQKSMNFLIKEINSLSDYFITIKELKKENEILKKKIKNLEFYKAGFDTCSKDRDRLLDIMGIKEILPYPTVYAKVVLYDFKNWFKTIIIDKGENSGIKIGSPVINEFGLIGRVYKVNKNSSVVLLITDHRSSVGCMIFRSREIGILSGQDSDICKILFLNKNADVKIGDIVMTSGLSEKIPKGIIVGKVTKIDKLEKPLLLSIDVKPAVDFGKIEDVMVLLID